MTSPFWKQHSIKDQVPDHPDHQQPKPFVTPGLAARQKQASAANTEKFEVDEATGMHDLSPLAVIPSHSASNSAARRTAQQKVDVANSGLERQQAEAVRRYGKGKP